MRLSPRHLLLVALLGGLVALAASDAVLFAWPDALSRRVADKLSGRYRRHGVLAHWTFDDPVVVDGVSGAAARTVGTTLVDGRYGRARAFAGNDEDHVTTRLAWAELGDRYTISVWARLGRVSPRQSLVFTEARHGAGLLLWDGELVLLVPGAPPRKVAYPFEAYDRFVNVTAVVDGPAGTAALYEDGTLRGRAAIRGVAQPAGVVEFGKARTLQIGYALDGALDETVLWRRALSAAEVREVAQAPRPLDQRIAAGYVLGRRAVAAWAGLVRSALKLADRFDPRYHPARLERAGLPLLDIALSRADWRAFARWRDDRLERGAAPTAAAPRRRVRVTMGGRLHDAELEPYGSPASWLSVKPAFRLDGEALVPLLGARSLVFLPPEAPGPLRPLLARWARERAGLPEPPGGVMLVRLDGAPTRLYRFAAYLAEPPAETMDEAPETDALARLPVPAGDLLAAYDALRARVEPLLLHDKTGAWPSREVRYRLRREREALEAWSRGPAAPGPVTASRLLEPLDERLILNGNPAPSFVIGDLGPGAFRPPGARVTWTSSHPALIAPDGRVTRPGRGPPVRVRLEASVDREGAAAARPLHFTVIPRGTRLPLVRLRVPGEIPNTHRTPALAEFLDDDGVGRSGWLAAAVELRGNTTLYHPKKSYSLRLDTRYRLPGFSGSSVVHLVGSQVDPSLMKNKLAYDLFRSFGEPGRPRPSPRIELVELFVNDEYHGIYQLSERVDRFLLGFPAFDPREARQAVIYKAQGAEANLRTMVRRAYRQVEPDPRHGEYWTPLEELVAFAGGAEPAAFTREVADRIDLPTFVDFHLLVNLFANREGVRFNLFLARDRAEDSRFVIVPWDYDKTVLGEPRGWLTNFLLLRLGKELPEYTEQLKRRWRELRRRQLADAAVLERIDGIEATLAPSLAREFARWPRATSHAETVREMKAWLPERLRYLDRRIAALTPG